MQSVMGKTQNIVALLLLNCFIFVMSAKYNIEDTKQNKLSSIDLIMIYLKSYTPEHPKLLIGMSLVNICGNLC